MPPDFDFLPEGLWGPEYRAAGGINVPDYLAQLEASQLPPMEDFTMPELEQEVAPPPELSIDQFVDWPTYQSIVSDKLQPYEAYDEYVNIAMPIQMRKMGYSEEEIQAELQQFASMVPAPPADYGVLGNLWESAKSGFASGTRAERAAGNMVAGDLDDIAKLVVDQAAGGQTAPLKKFYEEISTDEAKADFWEAVKAYAGATWSNPEGAVNFLVEQLGQSYPALLAGGAGALGGAAVSGPAAPLGAVVGGVLGTGAGSASMEVGAQILERIASEAQARGVDPRDTKAIREMIADPEVYGQLRDAAVAKGLTVGAADAAISALTFKIGGVAAQAARSGRGLRASGLAAGGLGVESTGGAAGEALSQVVAGDDLNYSEIVGEAFGELGPGAAHLGMGALMPQRQAAPGAPPVPTPPTPEDLDEGDLPGAGGAPSVPQAPDPFSVMRGRTPPVVEPVTIDAEEINVGVPPGFPPDIEVIEGDPEARAPIPTYDVATLTPENITILPAQLVDSVEQRIADGRLLPLLPAQREPLIAGPQGVGTPEQIEELRFQERNAPQYVELSRGNVGNGEVVNQWLADHGVVLESKEQMDAIATIVAAPGNQRQAAIADVISGLADSQERGAEQLTEALLAMSRILPQDPRPKPTPAQAATNLVRDLGVTPDQVIPTVTSALAREMVDNIAAGVTDAAEAQPTATPNPVETIRQSRRGLQRGEPVPDVGLNALVNQLTGGAAGGAQGTQVQPRGGLRARQRQEGPGRSRNPLSRAEAAAPAGGAARSRAIADDTEGAPGVPRLIRGVAYGSQPEGVANKEAIAAQRRDLKAKQEVAKLSRSLKKRQDADTRKRSIDAVTMTKEEYEKTYPGRDYDEDITDLLDAGWTTGTPGVRNPDPIPPAELRRVNGARLSDLLNWMGATMRTPLQRAVAAQLERLDLPADFRVYVTQLPGATRGVMKRDGTIHIDPAKGTMQTLLHEAVHAATTYALMNPRTAKQRDAVVAMNKLFEYAKANSEFTNSYGFTNVFEFTSEALANPAFQKELAAIPLPKPMQRYSMKNVLDMFKRLVLRLLGVNDSDTVLSEAILTASDLFDNVRSEAAPELADQASRVPTSAILGTKDGARAFIAYAKSKNDPNTSYTLYTITPTAPRGDPATKQPNLSRDQVDQYIRAQGATVVPPANSIAGVQRGQPKATTIKKVGYAPDGSLRSVAFEQKDGTWTYYESDDDVRTDPDARVSKGLSLDQVQRAISGRGLAVEPPTPGAVRPDSPTPTAVGYEPAGEFRRSVQDMEGTLKNIPGVDVEATLRNSRVQRAWRQTVKNYIDPARKAGADIATRFGKSQQEIEKLLEALHVSERMQTKIQQYLRGNLPPDERTAKVNEMQAKQRTAEQYVQDAQRTNLAFVNAVKQELSPKIKAMSDNTIDLAASYGLISRDTAETIKKAYDYYVPLQTGDRTTIGKAATGASVTSDNSFARMVEQVSRTIARGEMNRVRKSVLDLVRTSGLVNNKDKTNPVLVVDEGNPDTTIRYNAANNSLDLGVNNHVFDDNAIDVYEDGHRVRMVISDDSLLEALHPYKGEQRKTAGTVALATLARINHIVSVGKTTLNPAWAPFNFVRDVLTANVNLPPGVSRTRFMMELANPSTIASVMWNVAREGFGKEPHGLYADAKDAGGFISHRQYLGGTDEVAADMMALFQPTVKSRLKKYSSNIFDVLAIWPQMFESTPRFAMYKAARAAGMSKERAAVAAKTASVNFEQRGRKNLSSYWIFANAKMQGIHALYQAMKRAGPVKASLGAAGIVSLGVLAAAMGHENAEKDKDGKSKYTKIPNYKKDSLILFDEDAVGIPIPQEVSPLYVLGHAIQEARMGATSVGEAASRIMTSIVNNAWPGNVPQQELAGHKANGLEFMLRAVLPSYVLPVVDVGFNKNTFGNEVVSNMQNKLKQGMPKSEMGSPTEDQLAVNTAKWLYKESGGYADWAPQQIKLFNNFFNPAAEGFAFMRDLFVDRDPKYRGEVVNPFARKFVGAATDFYDSDQFDELLAKSARAQFLAEKHGISSLTPEEQALAKSAAMLAKVNSDAGNLFKGNNSLTKERRDLLNERKREMILGAIGRYNDLRDRMVPKK